MTAIVVANCKSGSNKSKPKFAAWLATVGEPGEDVVGILSEAQSMRDALNDEGRFCSGQGSHGAREVAVFGLGVEIPPKRVSSSQLTDDVSKPGRGPGMWHDRWATRVVCWIDGVHTALYSVHANALIQDKQTRRLRDNAGAREWKRGLAKLRAMLEADLAAGLAVVVGGDFNWGRRRQVQPGSPDELFRELGLSYFSREVMWLAWSDHFRRGKAEMLPRPPGSDHIALRIRLTKGTTTVSKIPAPDPEYLGPPKRHGGYGNKPIRRVTVHCTAGSEPGLKGAARAIARYFRITERYASAHYAADSRESVQCAWDSVICYHAPPNPRSIGYELCCSLSNEGKGHWDDDDHQAMLRIAAKDIAQLCLHYGLPIRKVGPVGLRLGRKGICGHNDVRDAWRQTTHWDPGPHFPWKRFIAMVKEEAAKLQTEGTVERERQRATRVSNAHEHLAEALALLDDAVEKSGRGEHVKAARRMVRRAKRRLPRR